MRKLLSLSLVLFIALSVASFSNSTFASSKTTLSISCDEKVVFLDSEFTLSYDISDGDEIYAIGFDALYEENKFELVKVIKGDFLEQDKTTTLPVYKDRTDDGTIIFAITRTGDADGVDGNGTIVKFVFKALEIGTFDFKLENIILKDPSGADMKSDSESFELIVSEEDTEPPTLEIEEIGTVSEPNAVIKGKTEPEAIVTVDGEEIEVSEDGSFEHEVSLEVGENTFEVISKDKASNETKKSIVITYKEPVVLKFQIGNKTVYVNDEPVEIEAAPFVDKVSGRTMVPIRIVAESVGAEIGWEGSERKITLTQGDTIIELWIDKPIAKVNGVPTPIDMGSPKLAPFVVNGRTVLPLRFVAENLGCAIGWDGATQTITLTYPNPDPED
ncbi:MAG: hypothetical protein KAH01_08705 [Caldisericia bacterium]|nr:hypothetical protein [Caldisericia bacterium]